MCYSSFVQICDHDAGDVFSKYRRNNQMRFVPIALRKHV